MNLLSRLHTKSQTNPSPARHEAFIDDYLTRLERPEGRAAGERAVSILARSPQSPAALALMSRGDDLKRQGVVVRAIFAEFGADGALARFSAATGSSGADADPRELIRWARNIRLRDAHEQVTLGAAMCWSGDCMRRDPGKRDSLDLFESDNPKVVRLGSLAFEALWAICEQVPLARLQPALAPRPSAACAEDGRERLSAFSFLRRAERSNTLAH